MKGWARLKTQDIFKIYLKQIEDREPTLEVKTRFHELPNDQLKLLRLKKIKEQLKIALSKVEHLYHEELKKEVNSNGKHS